MAAHVLFVPPRDSLCVCSHSVICVSSCQRACVCIYTVRVLEPCVFMRSYAALSAAAHVVSHFELLLSDSYRLDVCVVEEASKQHFALCSPLEKVTLECQH